MKKGKDLEINILEKWIYLHSKYMICNAAYNSAASYIPNDYMYFLIMNLAECPIIILIYVLKILQHVFACKYIFY